MEKLKKPELQKWYARKAVESLFQLGEGIAGRWEVGE